MFTDMFLYRRKTGETAYDITMCMNGALSGLVAKEAPASAPHNRWRCHHHLGMALLQKQQLGGSITCQCFKSIFSNLIKMHGWPPQALH